MEKMTVNQYTKVGGGASSRETGKRRDCGMETGMINGQVVQNE